MRILVSGLIGQYAFGGVTWDYIQYVLGFRALGHDVWYFEDSATWAYDPGEGGAECRLFAQRQLFRSDHAGIRHGRSMDLQERG